MTAADQFWPGCLAHLEATLSPQQFNTWIKPLQLDAEGDGLSLIVTNQFALNFVRERFLGQIQEFAEAYFDEPVSIELKVVKPNAKKAEPAADEAAASKAAPSAKAASAIISPKAASFKDIGASHETTRLNPNYTFETLVTGKANQIARAAAHQIAEYPGQAYNPLFIYGGSGLGKTHLIQAIGNFVHLHNTQAKIRYIHAERYVADVVRAYQHKAFDEFKRYYHSLDLLLIDDIQFFSGKNRTQEEFFYAFNALIEAHKQVIITSDRIPKEIEGMEDRLISRFGWGLVVAIEPPELEMRVAILLKKAESEGFRLDSNVAFFIAKNIRSNVRELEGALKRVLAYSRFTGQPITLESAKDGLKDILAASNRQISVENIQKTVADFYKIKVSDMHSKKRTRDVARPRQMAMAMARELTQMSLPAIGDAFGGRDHTTVLHASRTIAELRQSDSNLNHDYTVLIQILRN